MSDDLKQAVASALPDSASEAQSIAGNRRTTGNQAHNGTPTNPLLNAHTPMNTPQTAGAHVPASEAGDGSELATSPETVITSTGAAAAGGPASGSGFTFNFDPQASSQFAQVLAGAGEADNGDDGEVDEEALVAGASNLAAMMAGMGGADGGEGGAMAALMQMMDPSIMSALQSKFEGLIGMPSGLLETAPVEVKRRVSALRKIEDERVAMEQAFQTEFRALEIAYAAKFRTLEEKQMAIVTGEYEPTDADLVSDEELEGGAEGDDGEVEVPVGLPRYWLSILQNNSSLEDVLAESDYPVLESLIDVTIAYPEDNPGFDLVFTFADNEYFTNKVLTKSYTLETDKFEGPMFKAATATAIEWKDGRDVRSADAPSFFDFFYPPVLPEDDEVEAMEPEELHELRENLQMDHELGMILQSMIPRAASWFTGTAALAQLEAEGGGDPFMGYMGGDGDSEYETDDDDDVPVHTINDLAGYNSGEDEDYVPGNDPPPADCSQQ
ncbi:NAP-1 is [Thecamonas trahens ATCC 50062]|uniref:NAP-1 is n=1 Tax=Thecamonas trahens ATCC 50062 TaxID=461836 RepID=A0A0L0D4V2_THETB|nr:NAP-1 is [Thecamonas trahens ATCC 50062]KNC47275.1 NAP-1 is [Thecamonas trahens ATCC 50062]|eukprot:XP_013759618.1 NAP-1 is [Thecamonas trahens ATCC 50062]